MLTGKQRAYLRALAQKEDCVLYVGKAGVTGPVIEEARDALAARELIKGRVQEACPLTAAEAQAALCRALEADGVQVIGRVFVLYKRNEKAAKLLSLPRG